LDIAAGNGRDAPAISGPLDSIDLLPGSRCVYRGSGAVAVGQMSDKATIHRSGNLNGIAPS
jgi:hypothetical protein